MTHSRRNKKPLASGGPTERAILEIANLLFCRQGKLERPVHLVTRFVPAKAGEMKKFHAAITVPGEQPVYEIIASTYAGAIASVFMFVRTEFDKFQQRLEEVQPLLGELELLEKDSVDSSEEG